MAKQYNIRWRDSDRDQLRRAINNFNAKLRRVRKKNPEMEQFLPQPIRRKDVYDAIETRADFNRTINSLRRFSKRGAEEPYVSKRGAKMTKWAKTEFKRKEREVNRRKEKERKRIEAKEVKIGGKSTGVTRAEMGTLKQNELKPSHKNPENMSQKEWELAMGNIDQALNRTANREKMEAMRENYIKGLREGGFLDADPELEKLIRGVDAQKFYETVELDETATFIFYRDPIQFQARADKIRESWENAYNNK